MKALSILQPWAWLILRPDIVGEIERQQAYARQEIKDIENRTWPTNMRGEIYVHAGKRYSKADHDYYAEQMEIEFGIVLPAYNEIPRGGIVGKVQIVGCEWQHPSCWKIPDQYGFLLADARPLPFRPYRGQLQFFEIDETDAPAPDLLG